MKNERLLKARLDKGWSQEMAADKIGVAPRTFQTWEEGGVFPNFQSRQLVRKAFGCSEADLFEGIHSNLVIGDTVSLVISNQEKALLPSSLTTGNSAPGGDWATWFGLRLARILTVINSWRSNSSFSSEMQTLIDQEIRMIDHELSLYPPGEAQTLSRRQMLTTLAALPTALILGPGLVSDTAISDFLPQCAASITSCWYLMKGKGFSPVNEILARFVPTLATLALRPSPHQVDAARLATQSSIIQGILAMHQLNFGEREAHCKEAIRYASLAQNNVLHAGALMYLGYTYSHCYYPAQPHKAIPVFHHALQTLGDEVTLLRSDILMGLSDAYAQTKAEQEAIKYSGLAQEHFPQYPEYDPSFIFADCGLNTLYQWTGKAYIRLAEHFPDAGYQQIAADNLMQSIGTDSISDRSTSETAIYRADSARILGELDIYADTLRQATSMALEIGSRRRFHDAQVVFSKTPENWQKERPIKSLAKEVFKTSTTTKR